MSGGKTGKATADAAAQPTGPLAEAKATFLGNLTVALGSQRAVDSYLAADAEGGGNGLDILAANTNGTVPGLMEFARKGGIAVQGCQAIGLLLASAARDARGSIAAKQRGWAVNRETLPFAMALEAHLAAASRVVGMAVDQVAAYHQAKTPGNLVSLRAKYVFVLLLTLTPITRFRL